MVADEVMAGLGRCGKLLCVDWENVKPDVVTIAKSLSGGFMPVSAVLGKEKVMKVWDYGDHSSTFSANPLGVVIAKRAVEVLFEDKLIENAEKLGKILADELRSWNFDFIEEVQCGKGLFASVKFKDNETVWLIARFMQERGVLCRPEVGFRIKIMPPLCLTEEDLRFGLATFKEALEEFKKKGKEELTGKA